MQKLNALDLIAILLVVVGALNWGLVGIFRFNLVSSIFGDMSFLSIVIYDLVGLSAVYLAFLFPKLSKKQ